MTGAGRLQHVSSGGLSLLVHGLFLAALMFGVSWKTPPLLPVQADLWAALPEPPPALQTEPPPAPEPPPVMEPPATKAVPSPPLADIALEKAKRSKQEAAHRLQEQRQREVRAEELRREEARRLEAQRREEEALRQEEARKQEEQRRQQEREKREQARRQVEQELARQLREDLEAEQAQLRALQDRARASRQLRLIDDAKTRIQAKIQSHLRLPPRLSGNPEAMFEVTLLPNGEVVRATLLKSSGQPAYDSEVERAILRASPLPLPAEREAAQAFREGLILKFRPFPEGEGGA